MHATAQYEDGALEAHFRAPVIRDDLGVPRSGFWRVATEDADLTALSILGVDVDPEKLPEPLRSEVYELRNEINDNAWSRE